jgi:hypothetical protein
MMVEDKNTLWRTMLEKQGLHQETDILEKYGIDSETDLSDLDQHEIPIHFLKNMGDQIFCESCSRNVGSRSSGVKTHIL